MRVGMLAVYFAGDTVYINKAEEGGAIWKATN